MFGKFIQCRLRAATTDARAGAAHRLERLVLGTALVIGAGTALAQAHVQVPVPDSTACPAQDDPAIDPGATATMPGHWHNPYRNGTGWDFYYTPGRNDEMIAFWYSYDDNGLPTWYLSSAISLPGGATTWTADLYQFTLDNSARRTTKLVGSLSGRLYPGSATRMGLRWRIDGKYTNPPTECIYDVLRESPLNAPAGEANAGYNGNWYDPTHDYWGYNYSTGQLDNGNYADTEKALVFDVAGKPVWLMAMASGPGQPPSNTTGAPRGLDYMTGMPVPGYSVWRPDVDCSKFSPGPCFRQWRRSNGGSYGNVSRNFTSQTTAASATVAVAVPSNVTDGSSTLSNAAVTWPNPAMSWPGTGPLTFPTTLVRGTQIDHVYVDSSYCRAPNAASLCSVNVAWASTPPAGGGSSPNKLYRRNAFNDAITLVSNAPNGGQNDALPPGSRVQYELRNGNPTGTLVAQSAEVLVTVGSNDSTAGAPDTPPSPTPFQEPSLDVESDKVGALDGEFKVTEGGHATYRINLFTPRGRGGLAPPVALTYSSAGGEGVLGTGFNLEATSSIQRCRSGKEFGDGDAVSNELNQFCLDGQRLLLVSGSPTGTAEYRTEIESFQRIVGTPVNITSLGTAIPSFAFTVTGKDGSVRTFGGEGGTVVGVRFGPRNAISWQQTSLADVSGNTITYTWSSQGSGSLSVPGERVLTQIAYSGGSLDFTYQASGRRDFGTSILGDALATRLLAAVTVRAADSSVLRHYPVSYANSSLVAAAPTLVRPRVTRIGECADVAQAICYPATTFSWVDPATTTQGFSGGAMFSGLVSYRLGDFNGDGRSDLVWTNAAGSLKVVYATVAQSGSNVISFTGNAQAVQLSGVDPVGAFQTFDWDADGQDDLLYLSASPGSSTKVSWYWARSTGSGFAPGQVLLADAGNFDSSNELRFESTLVDNDGDGLPDLMYKIGTDVFRLAAMERTNDLALPYRFAAPLRVEMWDYPNASSNACTIGAYTPRRDEERAQSVDVDADGRGDLRIISTAPACGNSDGGVIGDSPQAGASNFYFTTYKSLGKRPAQFTANEMVYRFERFGRTVRAVESTAPDAASKASQRVMSADINADGFMDIVYLDAAGQWHSNLTTGESAFGTDAVIGPGVDGNHRDKVQLLDFDGDGKLDFWWPDSGMTNRNYRVYLWKGDAFASTPVLTDFVATSNNDWRRLPGDFDGDGLVDMMLIKPADGGWQTWRATSHHQPRGVVGTITNGLGATTSIAYAPLTFASVYRRDYDGVARLWGRGSAVFDLVVPNYVVQFVGSSAPTQGDPGDQAMVQYRYAGLKIQAGGRGSLGFREVRSIDMQTNVEVQTSYLAEFPLTAMPQRTYTQELSAPPTDACHLAGQVVETDACFNRPPACPSSRLNVCDQWPIDAGARRYRSASDAWGWRFQRAALSDANPPAPLNDYNVSLSQVRLVDPPMPIFVGRTLNNVYVYGDDVARDNVSFTALQIGQTGYDDFGNTLVGDVTTRRRAFPQAGEDDTQVKTQTRHVYANNPTTWKLGRLASTTNFVTRTETRGGIATTTTQGRRASFTYNDPSRPGDTRGLLYSERVEAMTGSAIDALQVDPNTSGTVSYYTADAAGNRINTATCSTSVPSSTCPVLRAGLGWYVFHPTDRQVMRYTNAEYDSLLRYVDKTREAVSNGADSAREAITSTVLARNAGGDPTDVQDANGLVARTRYGQLGRARFSYAPDGASVRTDWARCTAANCPSNMALAYVSTVTTSGAPKQWSFHDVLGRPVIALQQGLGSSDFIAVVTFYDARGNVERVSEPFYAANGTTGAATPKAGETLAFTVTVRDGAGRVTRITAPDGGLTKTDYLGPVTVTTLPANAAGVAQVTTQVTSPQGEVVSVTDHKGLTVTYAYDASGQVLRTSRNGKVTTATYDGLGRKIATTDPDAGTWSYAVNDAGETILQRSPRGMCTLTSYDGRGRQWKRVDYTSVQCTGESGTATWQFDTALNGIGKLASVESTEGNAVSVTRTYVYNGIGQLVGVNTAQDGRTYAAQSTYDQFGRPFQSFFSAPGLPATGEKTEYNAQGYAYRVRSAWPAGNGGPIYQEILAMDARGKIRSEHHLIGAEVLTTRQFNPYTGRLVRQQVQNGMPQDGTVQDVRYDHDLVGNMRWRESVRGGTTQRETFAYDELQRLTGSTFMRNGSAAGSAAQSYDGEGNIVTKGGRSYTYSGSTADTVCASWPGAATPGPHAVSRVGSTDYCYDASGNVTRIVGGGEDRQLTYTPYDAVRSVRSDVNGTRIDYNYGPSREKVRRLDYPNVTSITPTAITEYVGDAEVRVVGGVIDEVKRYAGAVLVRQYRAGENYEASQQLLVVDALGSTELVLDVWGQPWNASATMSFDAFGQRRRSDVWTAATPWTPSLRADLDATTRHGYTGHEQADEVGVVHMNGRIYDPSLGRFLQADPFVQAPFNAQSLNRYSYVFNNPMAYTDPTGYFGSRERAGVRTGISIVISFFLPGALANAGLSATQAAIVTGAVAGAVQSGNARGAVMGALTAAAFSGIDRAFKVNPDSAFGGLSQGRYALRALSNGAAGGVLSMVQGGRFGHGFVNAGLGDYLTPAARREDTAAESMLRSAITGGTLSAITGGDFANGAMTAAFKAAVGAAKNGALSRRMMLAANGLRADWVALDWDVFFFGAYTSSREIVPETPLKGPRFTHLGVERVVEHIGIAGYSSTEEGYLAYIIAAGAHADFGAFEAGAVSGYEVTTNDHFGSIDIVEGGVPLRRGPFGAEASVSGGVYHSKSDTGIFLSLNGGVLGEHASLGVGGSINVDQERRFLQNPQLYMWSRAYENYHP